nr:PucR family transcriptional regulator ligand-binding domain-containing protein [Clostridioides sp.]
MGNETTVRDILNNPQFEGMTVIAGEKGLDRVVRSITVMDAPDPFPWTNGYEIVLCSGYIFKINPDQFENTIQKLHDNGMSSLFIKLSRFIKLLPDDVKQKADELNFPIIDVPLRFAFIDVINPALIQIIDHQSESLKLSEEINNRFSNIVINNEGMQVIIDVLSDLLKENLMYFDLHFQKMYFSNNKNHMYENMKKMNIKTILEEFDNYRIGVNIETYGYIIFLNENGFTIDSDANNALSHVNTAIILDVQKKISSMQIKERHRNEFVQDLIMNNIKFKDEIKSRASIYGWDFSGSICAMVVDIDDFKEEYLKLDNKSSIDKLENESKKILQTCVDFMKIMYNDTVYVKFSDRIVFLIQQDDKNESDFNNYVKKLGDDLRAVISSKHKFTATVGFGSIKSDVMETHKSYEEANLSIKIGRVIHKGHDATILYEKLGVYRLLYTVYKNEETKIFYKEKLSGILDHDENYNSELLKTLICIIDNDWNLKNSAKDMFIHYNTMKYRYKKICELVDDDLTDYESKVNVLLAVRIYQMFD